MAADKNGDGRLDAEELRALLKKHRGTFTDKEVEDLGEMFYAVCKSTSELGRRRGLWDNVASMAWGARI